MKADSALIGLFQAIGGGQRATALQLLSDHPELTVSALGRADECFLDSCLTQLYAGDTALHVAAFAFDPSSVRQLLELGSDVRARNRRGAEPIHSATIGNPTSSHWNPEQQCAVLVELVDAGADPNARAVGGVTPLHRAVRNRCSAAVVALLELGADPALTNDSGSTVFDLAQWSTGRGGSGSPVARAEQALIVNALKSAGRAK